MDAVGGQLTPLFGRAARPLAPPRRALEAKFYAGAENVSMRTELRFWIATRAARSWLAPSALVAGCSLIPGLGSSSPSAPARFTVLSAVRAEPSA